MSRSCGVRYVALHQGEKHGSRQRRQNIVAQHAAQSEDGQKDQQPESQAACQIVRVTANPLANSHGEIQIDVEIHRLDIRHQCEDQLEEREHAGADGRADEDVRGHLRIPPASRQHAIPGDDGVRPARADRRFQRQVHQEQDGRRHQPIARGGHGVFEECRRWSRDEPFRPRRFPPARSEPPPRARRLACRSGEASSCAAPAAPRRTRRRPPWSIDRASAS